MPAVAPPLQTVEDYLMLDAEADEGVRYEFWKGEVFKLAGAAPEHNQVKGNIAAELSSRLQSRGYWVMTSTQRVRIGAERYVYPDVVVSCAPEYAETRPRTLLTPELIVEVTSASTGARDHSEKMAAYTQMEGLQEYWTVEPDRLLLAQYVRGENDTWCVHICDALDQTVRSDHFGFEVSLRAIYTLVMEG